MKLVVVESPAKAKTINKYLGSDYEVLASYGHVRDLPPKDGSVRPDEDFAKAAKKADAILLATDPDREGESYIVARSIVIRRIWSHPGQGRVSSCLS